MIMYSFDVGQRKHEEKARNKSPYAKKSNAPKLRKYLENKIKSEKYSPEATLKKAKEYGLEFEVEISVKTIYSSMDNGELSITRKDLFRVEGWSQKKKTEREKP